MSARRTVPAGLPHVDRSCCGHRARRGRRRCVRVLVHRSGRGRQRKPRHEAWREGLQLSLAQVYLLGEIFSHTLRHDDRVAHKNRYIYRRSPPDAARRPTHVVRTCGARTTHRVCLASRACARYPKATERPLEGTGWRPATASAAEGLKRACRRHRARWGAPRNTAQRTRQRTRAHAVTSFQHAIATALHFLPPPTGTQDPNPTHRHTTNKQYLHPLRALASRPRTAPAVSKGAPTGRRRRRARVCAPRSRRRLALPRYRQTTAHASPPRLTL